MSDCIWDHCSDIARCPCCDKDEEIERLREFLERGGIDSSAVLASEPVPEWRDEIEHLQSRIKELEAVLDRIQSEHLDHSWKEYLPAMARAALAAVEDK